MEGGEPGSLLAGQISLLDYGIFGFSLLLSIGTGIYHAIRKKGKGEELLQRTAKDEYLLGGRQMPGVPTALSLLTSFLSGILMLALPAEMFLRGAHIWLSFVVGALASLITATVFLPIFYKIRCTCIHEYFIHRYDSRLIRQSFSVIFLFFILIYMAIVIYAPAVSIASVMGVDKWILILVFGGTATLYTTIGGLKAVVWTDSLQAVMMYGGVIGLIWKALSNERVGGLARVWRLGWETGRLQDAFRLDPTLLQYNSFWINLVSGTITWLASFGVNQLSIQRYNSLPSLEVARRIIYTTLIPFVVLVSIVAFVGLLLLAYFYDCNPLESGEITDKDQLTMLFAYRILTPSPGLFGLYIACIMSATLSTLSSGMNSSAAAFYEDFLRHRIETNVTDLQATSINKGLVLTFGIIATLLAFCAEPLGGILRMCVSVMGAISGPMVGIFVLAIFWPRAGVKATFISFVLSNLIMCLVCYVNYVSDPYKALHFPTNSTADPTTCPYAKEVGIYSEATDYDAYYGDPTTSFIARISIYSYAAVGMFIQLAIGVPLSWVLREDTPANIRHLTYRGRKLPWPEPL